MTSTQEQTREARKAPLLVRIARAYHEWRANANRKSAAYWNEKCNHTYSDENIFFYSDMITAAVKRQKYHEARTVGYTDVTPANKHMTIDASNADEIAENLAKVRLATPWMTKMMHPIRYGSLLGAIETERNNTCYINDEQNRARLFSKETDGMSRQMIGGLSCLRENQEDYFRTKREIPVLREKIQGLAQILKLPEVKFGGQTKCPPNSQ